MRTITKGEIEQLVSEALPKLAFELPADIRRGLESAFERETNPRAAQALNLLLENAEIACKDRVAICQDTGSVWACLEFGPDICVAGDVLDGVQSAVALAYEKHHLRKSIVYDALLDRRNTGDNTPAFCELVPSERSGARLHLMCKGGGSDNASRVLMLPPSAGRDGIAQALMDCVREKAANACPPLVIGLGVGATFDKVASMAKHALLRPVGTPAEDERLADFEQELLHEVNASGIGAAALGGKTTALAVHVQTAPCHIAALPLAINMGCSAMRRASYEL